MGRREENMTKQKELEKKSPEAKETVGNKDAENTNLCGPTIGRRRDFSEKQSDGQSTDEASNKTASKARDQQDRMSAFIIGEEFAQQPNPPATTTPASKQLEVPMSPPPKERDSLM